LQHDNSRAPHDKSTSPTRRNKHELTNDGPPPATSDEPGNGDDANSLLVARARRAFHEFMPIRHIAAQDGRIYRKVSYGPRLDVFLIDMRSYRDSSWNKGDDRDACILGPTQLAWLKRELVASDATWKVIAADLPIGLFS